MTSEKSDVVRGRPLACPFFTLSPEQAASCELFLLVIQPCACFVAVLQHGAKQHMQLQSQTVTIPHIRLLATYCTSRLQ